jgi:hypothetical protein
MTIRLQIDYADGRREVRAFQDGRYEVGRDQGDIVLSDPQVSNPHARLEVSDGKAIFADIGSSNGTFDVLGARLATAHEMQIAQPVRLGGSSLALLPKPVADRTQAMSAVQQISAKEALVSAASNPIVAPSRADAPSQLVVRELTIGGRRLALSTVTGVVAQAGKHVTTDVYGSRGGSVSSTNTVHDQLMLVDGSGQEHAVHLKGMDVACRPGQLMTIVWAEDKRDEWWLVAAHNHATTTTYFSEVGLWKICALRVGLFAKITFWLLVVATFGLFIVSVGIYYPIDYAIRRGRMKTVRATLRFK